MRDNWYVYDDKRNTVKVGSADPTFAAVPTIGAMDDYFRVVHFEEVHDDPAICVPCRGCRARAGEKCVSHMTKEPIDVLHKSRQHDYLGVVFEFERYAEVEGAHI